jgi:hypothetical protein
MARRTLHPSSLSSTLSACTVRPVVLLSLASRSFPTLSLPLASAYLLTPRLLLYSGYVMVYSIGLTSYLPYYNPFSPPSQLNLTASRIVRIG